MATHLATPLPASPAAASNLRSRVHFLKSARVLTSDLSDLHEAFREIQYDHRRNLASVASSKLRALEIDAAKSLAWKQKLLRGLRRRMAALMSDNQVKVAVSGSEAMERWRSQQQQIREQQQQQQQQRQRHEQRFYQHLLARQRQQESERQLQTVPAQTVPAQTVPAQTLPAQVITGESQAAAETLTSEGMVDEGGVRVGGDLSRYQSMLGSIPEIGNGPEIGAGASTFVDACIGIDGGANPGMTAGSAARAVGAAGTANATTPSSAGRSGMGITDPLVMVAMCLQARFSDTWRLLDSVEAEVMGRYRVRRENEKNSRSRAALVKGWALSDSRLRMHGKRMKK
ncbi:hypothetical protein CLOM_g3402 [Closterium sp. NIES-68]|nr:hypothetical protein CLOM_g3402 [Closterium sp. NIES-68]GJP74561.1 hypothetical protein CLOP_g5120 [Closterium sp. NIES-67]